MCTCSSGVDIIFYIYVSSYYTLCLFNTQFSKNNSPDSLGYICLNEIFSRGNDTDNCGLYV